MFALRFTFPAGRYHATPWGRHVNEGAVAWPPEPWRLLRALIAVHHRKPGPEGPEPERLGELVEALAAAPPVFRLPPAVHAHTRHYMPQAAFKDGREATALVFDAFYRLDPGAELLAVWEETTLRPELFALASRLAASMGYLGRAESLAEAQALDALEGWDAAGQARPVHDAATPVPPGWELADVVAPLSQAAYAAALPELRAQAAGAGRPAERARAAACLPDRLVDALELDTAVLQAAGWSRPPASRTLRYLRPRVGPRAAVAARSRQVLRRERTPTTARFLLAGSPLPPATDAVKVGEVFRAALMHGYQRVNGTRPPPVLSGRDEAGAILRSPQHGHAFFLPEPNGGGRVEHLVLHAAAGLDAGVLRACEALSRLWLDRSRPSGPDDEDGGDGGRKEWRVALVRVGGGEDFADCGLLAPSTHWHSATPYLRPRFTRQEDVAAACEEQVRLEARRRGFGELLDVRLSPGGGREVDGRNTLAFHRFRGRRGLVQPDRTGAALQLTFASSEPGPIAFGFAAHFGLGLFASGERT